MKPICTSIVVFLLVSACGSSDSSEGGAAGTGGDGGAAGTCPNVAGVWEFYVSCRGPEPEGGVGWMSDMSYSATVTQTGCQVSWIEQDDRTATSWISSGTLEASGSVTLTGEFGFADVTTCEAQITQGTWSFDCSSEAATCTGEARRPSI